MKKVLFTIIAVLAALCAAKAQDSTTPNTENRLDAISADMGYRQLKSIYDYKDYRDFTFTGKKKYSVAGNGFASFFIPGLGQWIAGENGLGCTFFFCALAADVFTGLGAFMAWGGNAALHAGNNAAEKFLGVTNGIILMCLGVPFTILGAAAVITIDLISVKNAVRVSKVKNMYYDDLQRKDFGTNFDLKLTPYMDVLAMHSSNLTPVAGLSLKLNF